MPKVSVIIPIYNVEAYIERCVRSLMEQTLDDIEYIFVDDASPDGSRQVLEHVLADYPGRRGQVRIITHERNMGIAQTRRDGMEAATGEYVIHCDSDDWVDPDFYEGLYHAAKGACADIATGNLVVDVTDDIHIGHPIPCHSDWEDFLKSEWHILHLGRHLLRREFLQEHNLAFEPGIDYAEDDLLLFRCYYFSKRNASSVKTSSRYHYCKDNEDSLTTKRLDHTTLGYKRAGLERMARFVTQHGGDPYKCPQLIAEMRDTKESYYLSPVPDYRQWRSAFPRITPMVLRDSKLSFPYRVAWALGQYIHPWCFKTYMKLRH